MLTIDFLDETTDVQGDHMELVEKLLQHAATVEGIDEAEVSITFVTNEAIHEINRQYRDKDQPTDVISFALEEMGEDEVQIIGGEGMPRMLGDIIISTDRTREQAAEYGHSFERELGFLAVHGFLHLLGYDHMTEEDEKKMFGQQDKILESYSLGRDMNERP